MKIYVMCDLEGITGVVSELQAKPGAPHYEDARKLLMSDLNSAIEGATQAGATEILVYDMHYYGLNIILENLHPNARAILGKPCLVPPQNGLDETYSALFMVGLHSMAGTPNGIFPHTYTDDIESVHINNTKIGEIEMESALAGELGVPIAFISGDSKSIDEARSLLGEREYVKVKESLTESSAICLPPDITSNLIRDKAKEAVKKINDFKPFRIKPPIELKIRYRHPKAVPSYPNLEKLDKNTIMAKGDSLIELWKELKPK